MAKKRATNWQSPSEVFLVESGDQAVPVTGTLTGTGNSLNLANNQVGFVSKGGTIAPGAFIAAGTTYQQVPVIQVHQGTPNSSQINKVKPTGLGHQATVSSNYIDARNIISIATRKYEVPTSSVQVIEGLGTPVVNTDYDLKFTLEGERIDHFEGDNFIQKSYSVRMPATLPTNSQDFLLQNYVIDSISDTLGTPRMPYVMFGVKLAGGTGTALSAIQTGTTVTVAIVNGVTYTYTFTQTDIASLQATVAGVTNVVAATTIVPINPASVAPGSAATVDGLIIMGTDADLFEVFDDIPEVKSSIRNVGFSNSLTSTVTQGSVPFEGTGLGRKLAIKFNERARGLQYADRRDVDELVPLKAPIYIDESKNYTVTIVDHYDEVFGVESNTTHALKTYFLLEATVTNPTVAASGTYVTATSDTTTLADYNAVFGAWAKSANDAMGHISYEGDATAAAPFV